MEKFKKYFARFVHEDDGAELIEVAITIAIVAVVAAGVFGIVQIVQGKIQDASNLIGSINVGDLNHPGGMGGGSGSGGGNGIGD